MGRFEGAVFFFDPCREQLDECAPLLDIEQQNIPPGPVQMVRQVEDLPPEAFASG